MEKHTTDSLKARTDEMQIGYILIVPLEEEKEESHCWFKSSLAHHIIWSDTLSDKRPPR